MSSRGELGRFDVWDAGRDEAEVMEFFYNPIDKSVEWKPSDSKDGRVRSFPIANISVIQMGHSLHKMGAVSDKCLSISTSPGGSSGVVHLHLQCRAGDVSRQLLVKRLLDYHPRSVLWTFDQPRSGVSGGADVVIKAPARDLEDLKLSDVNYQQALASQKTAEAKLNVAIKTLADQKTASEAKFNLAKKQWEDNASHLEAQLEIKKHDIQHLEEKVQLLEKSKGAPQVSASPQQLAILAEKVESQKRQIAELKAKEAKYLATQGLANIGATVIAQSMASTEEIKKKDQAVAQEISELKTKLASAEEAHNDELRKSRPQQEELFKTKSLLEASEAKVKELSKQINDDLIPKINQLVAKAAASEDELNQRALGRPVLKGPSEDKRGESSSPSSGVDVEAYESLERRFLQTKKKLEDAEVMAQKSEALRSALETNNQYIDDVTKALARSEDRFRDLATKYEAQAEDLRVQVGGAKAETKAMLSRLTISQQEKSDAMEAMVKSEAANKRLREKLAEFQIADRLDLEYKKIVEDNEARKLLAKVQPEISEYKKKLEEVSSLVSSLESKLKSKTDDYTHTKEILEEEKKQLNKTLGEIQGELTTRTRESRENAQKYEESEKYRSAREKLLADVQTQLRVALDNNVKLKEAEGEVRGELKRIEVESKGYELAQDQLTKVRAQFAELEKVAKDRDILITRRDDEIRQLTKEKKDTVADFELKLADNRRSRDELLRDLSEERSRRSGEPSDELRQLRTFKDRATIDKDNAVSEARITLQNELKRAEGVINELRGKLETAEKQLATVQNDLRDSQQRRETERTKFEEQRESERAKHEKVNDDLRNKATEATTSLRLAQTEYTHQLELKTQEAVSKAVAARESSLRKDFNEVESAHKREVSNLEMELGAAKAKCAKAETDAALVISLRRDTDLANGRIKDLESEVGRVTRERNAALSSLSSTSSTGSSITPTTPNPSSSFSGYRFDETKTSSVPSSSLSSSSYLSVSTPSSSTTPSSSSSSTSFSSRTLSSAPTEVKKLTAPLTITLACKNLPDMVGRGVVDPKAFLLSKSSTGRYDYIAGTRMLKNNQNPTWTEQLVIPAGTPDDFKISIYDKENMTDSARVGSIVFSSATLAETSIAAIPMSHGKRDQDLNLANFKSTVVITKV